MSAADYCSDNAFAESAFASLKSELPDDGTPFASKAAASTTAVFGDSRTFYNRKRRHSSLGYQSPQAFLDFYCQNLKPTLNQPSADREVSTADFKMSENLRFEKFWE